jgi:omega-6 fatty acid desaturase (delta-12 desaturase)
VSIAEPTDTDEAPSRRGREIGPDGKPTGLKPVLDIIPAHCRERSTARGLSLFARDLAIYAFAIWGLLSTNNPLLLIPLWLLAGTITAGLFVLGHDAAHGALFDSKRLNSVVATVAFLPSLHAAELWRYGHNRVHHGHTLRQHIDFVWHPLTVEQYEALGPVRRARHRLEWGPLGAGAYYCREVWWNKMVRFDPPPRWAKAIRRDQAIVAAFALLPLVAAVALQGPVGGVWTWFKVIVVPFLLFCQAIGWVVHVHHIQPDIRWWTRREWNRYRGQVEGTTILWGPPGWDFFFHWIMVHLPHHVDMAIPCYRLPEAARAIAEAYPDDVDERPIRVRDYLASTKVCKLYDFDAGTWVPYPTR